jgi:SAM-dependent methyltransferase
MGPDGADQLAPLARIFGEVVAAARPRSIALLGCATGNGLEAVDPAVTSRVVGVDLNPEYLALARRRHAALGEALDLRCADLLACALEPAAFALVHAALVFEHLDPAALAASIAAWLAPRAGWLAPRGICSVVLQVATDGRPPCRGRGSPACRPCRRRCASSRPTSSACLSARTASTGGGPGRSRCGTARRSTSGSTAVDRAPLAACRAAIG